MILLTFLEAKKILAHSGRRRAVLERNLNLGLRLRGVNLSSSTKENFARLFTPLSISCRTGSAAKEEEVSSGSIGAGRRGEESVFNAQLTSPLLLLAPLCAWKVDKGRAEEKAEAAKWELEMTFGDQIHAKEAAEGIALLLELQERDDAYGLRVSSVSYED
ncbi:hypothetical protein Cni_G27296 [Canna indica]|uniref:Uncharacterized protein n=1 Tax=Canna indica TaxID=4628 RepID=A0AAQ3L0Y4_9LILI|nr:hypothetical protein Cni_G27296 [Canna indica]